MDALQNSTNTEKKTNVKRPFVLEPKHQMWIDYKAIGGWLTDPDSNVPKKMTITDFSKHIGVSRDLLYDWTQKIPDFWDKVATRRKEIGSQERLIKIHDTWYLKALSGSYNHMQLWLANFDPDFRMPTEKVEHDYGNGVLDLIAKARKTIDAEVIDAKTDTDNA